MKKFIKIISVVLILSLCFTVLSAFTYADSAGGVRETDEITDYFIDDSLLDTTLEGEEKYAGRLKNAENDLYTFVYKNGDGTNTMEIFDHPVKYVEKDGEICDISLSLEEDIAGYVPTAHDIKTEFPKALGDGIALSKNDISLTLIPNDSVNTTKAVISDDDKTVIYPLDEKTSYEYSLTYTGFKEDIVVEEYNGRTEYEFTLMTGGLTLKEEDGSYTLVNESGEVKAIIGDIIVFTADERNNKFGTMTCETIQKDQEYHLTIHLEDEYLRDENTKYPIRIDPTIELNYTNNGAGAILDMTVNSSTSTSGTSSSLYVGKRTTYGISRIAMRFPNLNLSAVASADNIMSATVSMRDLLCESEAMKVSCYRFNNCSFNESSSYTWSSIGADNYGAVLSNKTVSYSNGQSINHTYSFSITAAVREWMLSGNSSQNAIIFKADSSVENGSTYINKTFGSYNGTSAYRPSLKITYASGYNTSKYYFKYNGQKYNDAPDELYVGSSVSYAQLRMNCYGYAMGFILDGNATVYENGGYKQQPGEFAKTDKKSSVKNLGTTSPTTLMTNVIYNMKLDAERWGYTVTEINPTSSTVPQYGTSSRLIAVVTGRYQDNKGNWRTDFHFYRQDSDGIWSHKPGSTEVTDRALSNNGDPFLTQTQLTNKNIKSLANSGNYANGSLKFLLVSKSAAVDFPHASRCCGNLPCNDGTHGQTKIYKLDMAGDFMLAAESLPVTVLNGQLDYKNDYDWFRYNKTNTRKSLFTLTSKSSTLVVKIYNRYGNVVLTEKCNGSDFSLQVTGQEMYYICIYSTSGDIASYTFTYS